jgi:signal peptidase I
MKKRLKNFLQSNLYYFLVLIYLLYIFIIVIFSNNFGIITSYANISESMGSAIPLGSVVVVKSFSSYQVGDIISYYAQVSEETAIVTHRITAIGGNVYLTKGDANMLADRELVRPRLIIGKVILTIPYLGYFLNFSKSLLGVIFSIIGPALVIISLELMKILSYLKLSKKIRKKI